MIISKKQILYLIGQLHDHIALCNYLTLSNINYLSSDYVDWLVELRQELANQQSERLFEVKDDNQ